MKKLKEWSGLLFIMIVTIATYHYVINCGLVYWDDDVLYMNNPLAPMSFWDALAHSFTVYYHGDYFPVTLMTYWAEINLFGLNAMPSHIINLILHCAQVVLLYLFLNSFTQNKRLTFFVTLLFAFHPLQTETVMWISEKKSVLSGVFTLASLWLYWEAALKKSLRLKTLSLFLFVVASLAKSTAILLPVLFFFIDKFMLKETWKRSILISIPSFALAGVLAFVRTVAYLTSAQEMKLVAWNSDRIMMLPMSVMNAIWFYIEKFFAPINFSIVYPLFYFTPEVIWKSLASTIIIAIMGFIFWKRRDYHGFFFLCLFLLFLFPVLGIIPRLNYVNDRYMYLPIIGWAGALYCLFNPWLKIDRWKKMHFAASFVLILCCAYLSYNRSLVWENNYTLWLDTVSKVPNSLLARNALGLEYRERKEWKKAVEQFETILSWELPPEQKILAFNNLANIYSDRQFPGFNISKSVELLTTGINSAKFRKDTYEMRANLGFQMIVLGRQQEAGQILGGLLKDLETEPDFKYKWLGEQVKIRMGNRVPAALRPGGG